MIRAAPDMHRAFWWDIEGTERIGPIFPDTETGRRMHRLYLDCLAAVYSNERPPIQAVVDAAAEIGHSEADALALIEAAFNAKYERDEWDRRHRKHVEAVTGLPYAAALRKLSLRTDH